MLLLFSAALDQIREISSNAHAVAGRVQKFIQALTDNVQHVGESQVQSEDTLNYKSRKHLFDL